MSMAYPPVPSPAAIAAHFIGALRQSQRREEPYRRWVMHDVFPVDLCTAILVMPIVPPMLGATDGTRDTYNRRRTFFTPYLRGRYPVCENMATALQRPDVAQQLGATCGFDATGTFLRIEYIQDTDGMWLEPHRDIPQKVFSLVVYLCTGPDAPTWGTDIYDRQLRPVGRSSAEFNSGVIFRAGPDTWHGFERRPIDGVRRLLEINYVRDWRDREQLADPDRPIVPQASP